VTGQAAPPRLAIALCADLESTHGLDLATLAAELAELDAGAGVEVVTDLCHDPARLAELISRTAVDRLVLGLCTQPRAPHDFQAQVRKRGLDPFALELLSLAGAGPAAARLLAAAAARLRAFPGSRPEQLKLRLLSLEDRRSRRSLFTLPPSTYEPVASVAGAVCLGEERCGLCLSACPVGALTAVGGKAAVDRDVCVSCGICVGLCPAGAIGLPGASLAQYEAELAVLLSAESPRILFSCRRAGEDDAATANGWLPVAVPCLGMVAAGWILQALAGGAVAVALRSCGEACRGGRAAEVAQRIAYCRSLLALLGEPSPDERVVLGAPLPEDVPVFPAPGGADAAGPAVTLREPAASAQALLRLHRQHGSPAAQVLAHEGSPLGLVQVREETCTACGACPTVCPTGALVLDEGGEETVLSFDPRLCIACGRCVPVCPEQDHDTLVLRRATDLAALAEGRVVLKRAASARCRRCGRPIAPRAMLDRIAGLLGEEESPELLDLVSGLCTDCR